MAGTRGIAGVRGEQIRSKVLRDYHFDSAYKINEDKVDIQWRSHREILEDTKIDVFVQVNNKAVAGLSVIDVSSDIGSVPESTDVSTEGVVTSEKVVIRKTGTDSPIGDADSDVVYGRLVFTPSPDGGETQDKYELNFFSIVDGSEEAYTFPSDADNIDFRYVLRTNLSVIPVDAILNGGVGFVQGATDVKAYMNLIQLMKDVYGASGTLDNDGSSNLPVSIADQIANEVQDRTDADQAIRDDLASTASGGGASLVGVIGDPNYTGLTVQDVLTELAAKIKTSQDEGSNLSDRVTKLETEDVEEVYEAVGGETGYDLVNGAAKDTSVLLFINGLAQAPGINFAYKRNASEQITGFDFSPETLKGAAENPDGKPDVLLVKYKKIL